MKAIIKTGLFIMIGLFIFYNFIIFGLYYKVLGYRDYNGVLNKSNKKEIRNRFDYYGDNISNFSLNNTAYCLEFSFNRNCDKNPNSILENKKSHCKMYSYVFTSTYNYLAKYKNIKSKCRVAYGHLYFYGININKIINTPFFNNHDFCIIDNSNVAIDPLFNDYFGISEIKIK